MNDEEVKKQLGNMVNFILREAHEKANEIRVKAQEEFSIEKQRLYQGEKLKVMKEFDRKEKQVEVKQKIYNSNVLNQSRLQVLRAREEAVGALYHDAKKALAPIGVPGEAYKTLLHALVVQAGVKLEGGDCEVRARAADRDLVRSVLPGAQAEISKQLQGRPCKLSLDERNVLAPAPSADPNADSCYGGVVLMGGAGRIICDNTLDQRLRLAFEQQLPDVRIKLFGMSVNRRVV